MEDKTPDRTLAEELKLWRAERQLALLERPGPTVAEITEWAKGLGLVVVKQEAVDFAAKRIKDCCYKIGGCPYSPEDGGCYGEDIDCDYLDILLAAAKETPDHE
jgi:hypothetical protein